MIKRTVGLLMVGIGVSFALCSPGQAEDAIGIFHVALDIDENGFNQALDRPISISFREAPSERPNFHARVFRGTTSDLMRVAPDSAGCVRYHTVVLDVRLTSAVEMATLGAPGWLRPSDEGFLPERYVIVFESGDQPRDSAIRIHRSELEDYFRYAVAMKVIPPEHLRQVAKGVIATVKDELRRREEYFRDIKNSVCWKVKQIAGGIPGDSREIVRVAELSLCSDEMAFAVTGTGLGEAKSQ